jgi:lactoylglutathione lyase
VLHNDHVNIKRVSNVILAVKDLDKSVEFYNKVLGLPIKNERRTWVDLGQTGAMLSLHPASITSDHSSDNIDSGLVIGFLVGDVKSAIEDLRAKKVKIHREIVDKEAGKNAIILDPDGYMISLFEPKFKDKDQQSSGYHGFAPA